MGYPVKYRSLGRFPPCASPNSAASVEANSRTTPQSRVPAMTLLIRLFFAVFLAAALCGTASAEQRGAPIDDYIVSEAQSFENALNATWSTKGKDAKGWLAEGDKASAAEDHRAATGYYASSALLGKHDAGAWLKLARAYLAIETDKPTKRPFSRGTRAPRRTSRIPGLKCRPNKRRRLRYLPKASPRAANGGRRLGFYKASLALAAQHRCAAGL